MRQQRFQLMLLLLSILRSRRRNQFTAPTSTSTNSTASGRRVMTQRLARIEKISGV